MLSVFHEGEIETGEISHGVKLVILTCILTRILTYAISHVSTWIPISRNSTLMIPKHGHDLQSDLKSFQSRSSNGRLMNFSWQLIFKPFRYYFSYSSFSKRRRVPPSCGKHYRLIIFKVKPHLPRSVYRWVTVHYIPNFLIIITLTERFLDMASPKYSHWNRFCLGKHDEYPKLVLVVHHKEKIWSNHLQGTDNHSITPPAQSEVESDFYGLKTPPDPCQVQTVGPASGPLRM